MNILFVTPYVPSHIRTRPYNLVRALSRLGHHITLLTATTDTQDEKEQVAKLQEWGLQVEAFEVPLERSLSNCLKALPTSEPLQAVYSYHPSMERRIKQILRQKTFDVVHIEHLRASRMIRAIDDCPTVYDSVDCISLLFEKAKHNGAQLQSRLMTAVDLGRTRRYEAKLLTRYDQVIVTSRRDRDALKTLALKYLPSHTLQAPITVITNGVDLEYFCPSDNMLARDGQTIIFTGKMSYHANIAAVLHFATEILPHIWNKDPSVRFQIVGKDPPEPVRQLAVDRRIEVTGTVDDIRPYLASAAVSVCPARYAVGVQNKVLEAMAMETPVVSTPAGCAGLTASTGNELLIAEDETLFAQAVLELLQDTGRARETARAGRTYVEENHSWRAAAQRLIKVYNQACMCTHQRN